MDTPEAASTLPSRTTPTWEVELLISGVAVFAMLQLPGWLDDRMFALEPRVGADWRMILMLAYLYAKSAAIVLAVTFAVHLLLRAQWIALVGMDSVYPQGVRLERMRMGPIQRAIEEARPDRTSDAIEHADNRASVVFAIGVSVAFIIGFVCVFFCGALLLVTLFSQAIGWRTDPIDVMMWIFALVMLPSIIAGLADRALAGRLQPGRPAHGVLVAILGFYTRIGLGRRNNRIVALLTSNGGERRTMAAVVGIMVVAIVGVMASYSAMRGQTTIGSYAMFPDAEALRVDPAHYDDQRDPGRNNVLPYLQSMVVVGPYLKLVVPYKPLRDDPAMRHACADAEAMAPKPRNEARLACLSKLRRVTMDGTLLKGLQYEVASDPRTDRPALLAMIDVRGLARGRHELRVDRPPYADGKPDPDDPEPGFDRIVFWR
ncbi:MAG: hypothetical protein M3R16_03185 [Pseudomonadota bacterium]|nr:hypothetical protein [Pseudomonadota bacterium]